MTVLFDELSHTYEADGQKVPLCVSDVLLLAGISGYSELVPRHYIENAAITGSAVHKACEYLDEGDLELDSLDPSIAGYVMGYHNFTKRYEPTWDHIEDSWADLELGLAGTPDRIGTVLLNGHETPAIIDIKTPAKAEKHWGLQLTAYAILSGREDHKLFALHLDRGAGYELREYPFDRDTFMAALRVAHWRIRNGAKVRR